MTTNPSPAASAAASPRNLQTNIQPNFQPDPQSRLIVALDVPSASAAFALLDRLDYTCRWLKVGMELYYAAGNAFVEQLRNRGYSVFLDLKLHDIPNTVAGAVRSAAGTGASLLTLHASGGHAMMAAAADAAASLPTPPTLLAVTLLTSMDASDLAALGISDSPQAQVLRLARLATSAGITGLVCSPLEVAAIRASLAPQPLLVVPGIRPSGEATGDQRRTAAASAAIADGASMLVVGRPITRSPDPAAAARAILAEIATAASPRPH